MATPKKPSSQDSKFIPQRKALAMGLDRDTGAKSGNGAKQKP